MGRNPQGAYVTTDDLRNRLRIRESEERVARWKSVEEFRKIINELIMKTPTGELRNTYTDLNILFESTLIG